MEFTLTFLELVWLALRITAPVWLLFITLTVLLGQGDGRTKRWPPLTAIYWSLTTATTLGYGDLRPASPAARVLAVLVASCGLILPGIVNVITEDPEEVSWYIQMHNS